MYLSHNISTGGCSVHSHLNLIIAIMFLFYTTHNKSVELAVHDIVIESKSSGRLRKRVAIYIGNEKILYVKYLSKKSEY